PWDNIGASSVPPRRSSPSPGSSSGAFLSFHALAGTEPGGKPPRWSVGHLRRPSLGADDKSRPVALPRPAGPGAYAIRALRGYERAAVLLLFHAKPVRGDYGRASQSVHRRAPPKRPE